MTKAKVSIETFERAGHRTASALPETAGADEVLESIETAWCGAAILEAAHQTLAVCQYRGAFTVGVRSGNAELELVGDPTRKDVVEFAHGGQPAEWPGRYIVTRVDASRAIRTFLEKGTVEPNPDSKWEEQR